MVKSQRVPKFKPYSGTFQKYKPFSTFAGTKQESTQAVETNEIDTGNSNKTNVSPNKDLPYSSNYFNTDDIFKELVVKPSAYGAQKLVNATSAAVLKGQKFLYEEFDFLRGKRGSLDLAGFIKCATNCNPLSFSGYGCYCGFLGDGEPVDGIDTCVLFTFTFCLMGPVKSLTSIGTFSFDAVFSVVSFDFVYTNALY